MLAKQVSKPRKKSTAKSTAIAKIPQKHGGALNVGGTPGNKGGGRTPDEFKAMMAELASAPARRKVLQDILSEPTHPHFISAFKLAAAYGYGQPKETKIVEGNEDKPVTLKVLFSHE